jgi:hypothetical protein
LNNAVARLSHVREQRSLFPFADHGSL